VVKNTSIKNGCRVVTKLNANNSVPLPNHVNSINKKPPTTAAGKQYFSRNFTLLLIK
jgi:hypothetical protein